MIENALENFGLYHMLTECERMYAEWLNHGNLGYSGGVMDQPDSYWRDMGIMRLLELYVKHVATMPRMEQVSVFDTLRDGGRFGSNWVTYGNDNPTK